jgi:integrase
VLRLLRAMFNLGRDWEMLRSENPAARIKLFREKQRQRYLTPGEIKVLNVALAEEPDPYWRAFFALALLTGCRRSELLGAQWRQVDLDAKTLTLPVTKADRPHVLPLSDAALALLSSLPSRPAGGFIFPSHGKQGHLVEPKTAWRRICQRAGVSGCRIHDLRHSLASILIQRGYGIALVARILNHSQLSTTERYAHLDLESERRAIDDAASLISGSLERATK